MTISFKILTGATAVALAFTFAPVTPAGAQSPTDIIFQSGPGGGRDICGSTSVASWASGKSGGSSKVGENGSPQRFENTSEQDDCVLNDPDSEEGANGRCNDATRENGLGHVGDNNCPLG